MFRTPAGTTLVVGGAAIVLSEVFDVLTLEQMVVIGTMFAFAFVFVSAGVLVLRRTRPDLRRGFRVPLSPFVPSLAIASTVWLMLNLHVVTWTYFAIWMTAGLVVYVLYGRRHSRLARMIFERTGPLAGGRRGRHRAAVPERVA